jgi:hypothetical protein
MRLQLKVDRGCVGATELSSKLGRLTNDIFPKLQWHKTKLEIIIQLVQFV